MWQAWWREQSCKLAQAGLNPDNFNGPDKQKLTLILLASTQSK